MTDLDLLSNRSGDGTESSSLPLDITLQTFVGFVLAMVSVVNIAGDFKEIRAGIELGKRTWEHARNRPSFYVYNHRGKAFSPGVTSNAIEISHLVSHFKHCRHKS